MNLSTPFRHVAKGMRQQLQAAEWNRVLDSAKAHQDRALGKQGGPAPDSPIAPAITIVVQNKSGLDLDAFSVLAITGVAFDPTSPGDLTLDFQGRPVLTGAAPVSVNDPIAITRGPIPAGQLGEATVAGICFAWIGLGGSGAYPMNRAGPIPGDVTRLMEGPVFFTGYEQRQYAPAKILWQTPDYDWLEEDVNGGFKYLALIDLAPTPPPATRQLLIMTAGPDPDGYYDAMDVTLRNSSLDGDPPVPPRFKVWASGWNASGDFANNPFNLGGQSPALTLNRGDIVLAMPLQPMGLVDPSTGFVWTELATVEAAIAAGKRTVTVEQSVGLSRGQPMIVNEGEDDEEIVAALDLTDTSITAVFAQAHDAGATLGGTWASLTTIGTSVDAGAQAWTPPSVKGMSCGQYLLVDPGTASAEIIQLGLPGPPSPSPVSQFAVTFAKSHISSGPVYFFRPPDTYGASARPNCNRFDVTATLGLESDGAWHNVSASGSISADYQNYPAAFDVTVDGTAQATSADGANIELGLWDATNSVDPTGGATQVIALLPAGSDQITAFSKRWLIWINGPINLGIQAKLDTGNPDEGGGVTASIHVRQLMPSST